MGAILASLKSDIRIRGHRTSSALWKLGVAIRNPRLAWAYVNKARTIARLAHTSTGVVNSYYDEITSLARFVTQIESNLAKHVQLHLGFAGSSPDLYALTRIVKPSLVLETGVANGVSSAYILEAMRKNGLGRLISVSLPADLDPMVPTGNEVGWVVPFDIRSRWTLHLGSSAQLLPGIIQHEGLIDIFFHDSDHSYQNMLLEFETAWPKIKKDGFLIADDVWQNSALSDFCRGNRVKPFYLRNTGVVRRS